MRSACLKLATLVVIGALGACGTTSAPGGPAHPEPSPKADTPPAQPESSEQAGEPSWLSGTPPADLPTAEFLLATAVAPSAEEARAAALKALDDALWSDRAQLLIGMPEPAELFAPDELVQREQALPAGRVAALVAVSRRTLAERAIGWLQEAVPPPGEESWSTVRRIRAAAARLSLMLTANIVCERLRTLSEEDCAPVDPAPLQGELRELGAALELVGDQPHGIAFRRGEPPLRPLRARAIARDAGGNATPAAEVPLVLEGADGLVAQTRLASSSDGAASITWSGAPTSAARVELAIDREELAGPHAELLPERAVSVELRELTPASIRVAVYLSEAVNEQDTGTLTAGRAVAEQLGALGVGAAEVLRADLAALVRSPRPIAQSLRELGERAQGAIDVLVLGSARSDFTNRMGARSVWHEAAASATVYDAWTLQPLGALERNTQAVGIGDAAAAAKALEQVGKQLADDVMQLLRAGPAQARKP